MDERVIPLARGGVYVRTSVGAIQFGMPPETIKDVMAQSLDVPFAYVVPHELFDRDRGISVAEFEFPAYYNFFLLKRRARFVIDSPAIEARVRAVFQETLFGPSTNPRPDEFADGVSPELRPDLLRESDSFRQKLDGARLEIDHIAQFVHFDARGVADLGKGVTVRMTDASYVVTDADGSRVEVPGTTQLPSRPSRLPPPFEAFVPPAFGITVLGASHGFDPKGKTTGFILWLGARGILVDPPVDSTAYLAERGIAPKIIDGVILTHCHADHDAGTFQKLLEEQKVLLYTTPHILGSFLRKYSALSGLSENLLRRTFAFNPVRIGAPVRAHGAEIWFHYTLHSIPTVGFYAHYGGKSLSFSADTLYDPDRIRELHERGVLSNERAAELSSFPNHHTAVFHEAGIPPLHTPVSALAKLAPDVRERLYLVHIAKKDVPQDVGLRVAEVGLENTLRIDVATPAFSDAIAMLDVLCGIDFIRDLPLSRARELLQGAQRRSYAAGEKIVSRGDRGDTFYAIANGKVAVVQDGRTVKTYQSGDYFGETALILGQPRNADVVAQTAVELVAIDRGDFLSLLRGNAIRRRLAHLATMRDVGASEVIEKNSVLRRMTSAQKTQLQSYLEPRDVREDELLWSPDARADAAYLLDDAQVEIDGLGESLAPFGRGAFLAEVDALRLDEAPATSARVRTGGRVFAIAREPLCRMFDDNPGLLVSFVGMRFVE